MEIKTEVRKFIAENFLLNAPAETIDDAMPLITGGIIDSIGMITLMSFLEARFQLEFMPREIDATSLDTVERIEKLIVGKLAGRQADVTTRDGQQIR